MDGRWPGPVFPVRSPGRHQHLSHGDWRQHDSGHEPRDRRERHHRAQSRTLGCREVVLVFSAYEDDGYSIYALESAEALAGQPPVDLPRNAAILPPRRAAEGPVYALLSDPKNGLPQPETAAVQPKPTSQSWGSISPGNPRLALASIPLGPTPPVGLGWSSATCSATTRSMTGAQVTSRFDEFGGTAALSEQEQALELGRDDRSDAVRRARLRSRTDDERWAAGVRGARVPVAADRSVRHRTHFISLQPRLARGRDRRVQADRFQARSDRAVVFADDRAAAHRRDAPTSGPSHGSTSAKRQRRSFTTRRSAVSQARFAAVVTASSSLKAPARSRIPACSVTSGRITCPSVLSRSHSVGCTTGAMATTRRTSDFPFSISDIQGSCAVTIRAPSNRSNAASRRTANARHSTSWWAARSQSPTPSSGSRCGARLAGTTSTVRFRSRWPSSPTPAWPGTAALVRALAPPIDEPVVSVGAAMRINVFGFAVAEIDYVRPLDRPGRGWLWQFNLRPGF